MWIYAKLTFWGVSLRNSDLIDHITRAAELLLKTQKAELCLLCCDDYIDLQQTKQSACKMYQEGLSGQYI